MDLERPAGPDGHDSIFVNDQDVDNNLIWCDHKDNGIHAPRPELQPRHCNTCETLQNSPRRPRLGLLLSFAHWARSKCHAATQFHFRIRQARNEVEHRPRL
eukprot:gene35456-45945_t